MGPTETLRHLTGVRKAFSCGNNNRVYHEYIHDQFANVGRIGRSVLFFYVVGDLVMTLASG